MKPLLCWTGAAIVALGGVSLAKTPGSSAREKLIGAWRLVSLEEPGADGKLNRATDRKGILIYTEGYEASFGTYDVNEEAHTVTHHVEGSVTRGLVGKDLPRAFQFSDKLLVIKSTGPNERWSVTWERY